MRAHLGPVIDFASELKSAATAVDSFALCARSETPKMFFLETGPNKVMCLHRVKGYVEG